jgi:hypothetical protein
MTLLNSTRETQLAQTAKQPLDAGAAARSTPTTPPECEFATT